MKNKTSQQVRVGVFVSLALLLSMLAIFLLGNVGGLLVRQYNLFSRFEDISGLRIGAPVFLAGINVGKVEEIRFPSELEERKVVVTIKVLKTYQDRIRSDSLASVVTQGLLGDKAVFVTVGSPQMAELKDGMELQAKQGFSLDTFSEKGSELLENVNDLAKNVNSVIKDAKTKKSLVNALLYDPQGEQVVKDLSKTIKTARRVLGNMEGATGKKLTQTMANFETVSANLKDISTTIQEGKGSIGGLINDPTVYYDLMTLLGNANRNKLLRTVVRATLATNEKDLISE